MSILNGSLATDRKFMVTVVAVDDSAKSENVITCLFFHDNQLIESN